MPDTCTYNCSAHPTEISANSDISGIGVTVAFFATAWMVVLLLIGYYFVAYDPELDPFRQVGEKTLCQHPNAIDYVFLYAFRKLPGLRSLQDSDRLRSSQLESALNKCVIMFADIQIFTGLAVMISGYIALSCGLQSYHWQLAVYLVWLASLTHLAALSFLRNHLSNHPSQLVWRAIAMLIVVVLLGVAAGLAGHLDWSDGPGEPSDFAACYFREKMNTKSVAFESMLETLILFAYSFSIRLAKMSRRFEGGLRAVAARLSAKATRLQYGNDEDAPPQDPQTFSESTGPYRRFTRYSFLIAGYGLLSIHINLLTSFLAEVYWLTLSALWVTKRFLKIRLLGPKEENEWTFGQVLPVLLVVAPLAAILEHFLSSPANEQRQRSSQVALETPRQVERGEAQEDVRVDLDHRHIHSREYRGAFLLAAVAYIEVGIFFVADVTPGIKEPFTRLGVAFFIINPLLQLLWVHCSLCISRMNRSSLVEKTARGVVLGGLMFITVNEFILVLLEGGSTLDYLVYVTFVSLITLGLGFILLVLTSWHNRILQRERTLLITSASVLFPIPLVTICGILGTYLGDNPFQFISSLCVCFGLELAYFCFELFLEKMKIDSDRAVYPRCALLLFILAAFGTSKTMTYHVPDTPTLTASIIASAAIWVFAGTINSLVRSR